MTNKGPVRTAAIPNPEDLIGLWWRSSIAWPDGWTDTTTAVAWLQGPQFYADLRQPADRPVFDGVDCLRQLRHEHVAWLVRQEGFAGKLQANGGDFEWHREIDFQPLAIHPDIGRLRFESDLLIEEGSAVPYVEVWRRGDAAAAQPAAATALRDRASGTAGLILRVGATFMYARGRSVTLPQHRSLRDCVMAAANLRNAQDLLDCEISLGTVAGPCWTIEDSSLPFREGHDLCPRFSGIDRGVVETADVTSDGAVMTRRWEVTETQGAAGELTRPLAVLATAGRGDLGPGLVSRRRP